MSILRFTLPAIILGYVVFLTLVSAETYYITQMSNITCPDENVTCLTLTEYAQQSLETDPSSNITLTFAPGNHHLFSNFRLENIVQLSLQAENSNAASFPVVMITCNSSGFTFENISELSISGLEFNRCIENTVRSVHKFRLESCRLHTGHGIQLERTVNATIEKSSFVSLAGREVFISPRPYNNTILTQVGGAIIAQFSSLVIRECLCDRNIAEFGGSIFLEESAIEIYNCTFSNNMAIGPGGSIYVDHGSNIIIKGSELTNSTASYSGGAIDVERDNAMAIYNCYFINNTAYSGGAIYIYTDTVIAIQYGTFINNKANTSGGALVAYKNSTAVIQGCEFTNNIADNGGTLYAFTDVHVTIRDSKFVKNIAENHNGVIYAYNGINITIHGSEFINNKADSGGAIFVRTDSIITIQNCTFTNNKASSSGGALVAYSNSNIVICGCEFASNTAPGFGGAIYIVSDINVTIYDSEFNNNTATGYGGAISAHSGNNVTIHNSEFFDNVASIGGAIFAYSDVNITTYNSDFTNNIADTGGGAIFAFYNYSGVKITIHNSSFLNNKADYGGAIIGYHVTMILKNTTFINNKANTSGGALAPDRNANTLIYGCSFINNTAAYHGGYGGAIFAYIHGNITIHDSEFLNNMAGINVGGAIFAYIDINVTIHNSEFNGNRAGLGGVIAAYKGVNVIIHDSSFFNNTAVNARGGAVYGGTVNSDSDVNVTIYNSKFYYNTAGKYGGAIYAFSDANFTIHGSEFYSNTAEFGGAIYAFNDANLTVCDSVFFSNTAEYGGAIHADSDIMIHYSNFNNNSAKRNGGAIRAINVVIQLKIYDTEFIGNTAESGNGGALSVLNNVTVNLDNCSFNTNIGGNYGGTIYILSAKLTSNISLHITNSSALSGAVYAVDSMLKFSGNTNISNNNRSLYVFSSNVTFEGFTRISNNVIKNTTNIQEGGALTCFQSDITFQGNVTISHNQVYNGSGGAILLTESKIYMYGDTTITKNTALSGGGIYGYQSELNFQGRTNISNNTATEKGGGIHAISTTTRLTGGHFDFTENKAKRGGGMCLELNAKLYMTKAERECLQYDIDMLDCKTIYTDTTKWLRLQFTNNSADYGGALYISDNTNTGTCAADIDQSTSSECFFQGLALHSAISDNLNTHNIYFSGNSAIKLGVTIYGGLLDRCTVSPYAEVFNKYQNLSSSSLNAMYYLSEVTDLTDYDIQNDISSDPARVCICRNGQPDCNHPSPVYQVKKGQTFQVSLVTVDQVKNPVPSVVRAFLSSHDGGLDEGQDIQSTTSNCTELNYTVSSPHDLEQLVLYADGPCNDIGISQTQIDVEFLPCNCPVGFNTSSQQSSCVCNCDPDIYPDYITSCSIANASVQRRDNNWINYVNTSDKEGYLIYLYCPFDYCHPSTEQVWINLNVRNGANAQCAFNRSGKLCGSCEDGLSLTLGSSRCVTCSNNWLALLIVFAIAGVALVAFILICNLTIAVGTINGLIFYANILTANHATFFPFETQNFFTVFIAWLNLDFGFVTCFFDGMDGYSKTWLQFAFPFYIILIVVVIIKLPKYSDKFSTLIGKRNPIATLATLILLSYTKLVRTIISAWQFATLEYNDGDHERVWLVDANMQYFNKKHIPLFVVAFIVLLIGLSFTLFLFLWQWVLWSFDRVKSKNWFENFSDWLNKSEKIALSSINNPKLFFFMDAYHNPCNIKYRYWIGGLLFIRVFLYLVSALNYSANASINLLAIICVVGSLLLWKDMLEGKVYKNWLLNALEDSFLYNLIIFSVATLYIRETGGNQAALAYTSTSIAFITFLAIVLYHTYEYIIRPLKKTKEDEIITDQQNEEPQETNGEEVSSGPLEYSIDLKALITSPDSQHMDGDNPSSDSAAICQQKVTLYKSHTAKQSDITMPLLPQVSETIA